jgi:hypothetical protein
MALINPIQLFILPFVLLVALPLALCAGFTTVIAFLVLFLRLFVVYFDVGIETARYLIAGEQRRRYAQSPIGASRRLSPLRIGASAGNGSAPSSPEGSSTQNPRRGTKSRPGSAGSAGSAGGGSNSCATAFEGSVPRIPLSASAILTRDFEGVGGWRLPAGPGTAADALDDQTWESLNSRLELPDHQQQQQRHHNRSRSGGPILVGNLAAYGLPMKSGPRTGLTSPEGLRLKMNPSPNSSRSRTLGLTSMDQEGYFPSAATVLKRK